MDEQGEAAQGNSAEFETFKVQLAQFVGQVPEGERDRVRDLLFESWSASVSVNASPEERQKAEREGTTKLRELLESADDAEAMGDLLPGEAAELHRLAQKLLYVRDVSSDPEDRAP